MGENSPDVQLSVDSYLATGFMRNVPDQKQTIKMLEISCDHCRKIQASLFNG